VSQWHKLSRVKPCSRLLVSVLIGRPPRETIERPAKELAAAALKKRRPAPARLADWRTRRYSGRRRRSEILKLGPVTPFTAATTTTTGTGELACLKGYLVLAPSFLVLLLSGLGAGLQAAALALRHVGTA
jgi:hypothetical protein